MSAAPPPARNKRKNAAGAPGAGAAGSARSVMWVELMHSAKTSTVVLFLLVADRSSGGASLYIFNMADEGQPQLQRAIFVAAPAADAVPIAACFQHPRYVHSLC